MIVKEVSFMGEGHEQENTLCSNPSAFSIKTNCNPCALVYISTESFFDRHQCFFVLCRLAPTCKQHEHFDLDYTPFELSCLSTHLPYYSNLFLFLLAYVATPPLVFLTIIYHFQTLGPL